MGKLLKYVPTMAESSAPIGFASTKGSISFPTIGSEVTIDDVTYSALMEESAEFQLCVTNRVIIASTVPTTTSTESKEQSPIDNLKTDTEALTGNPKGEGITKEEATPKKSSSAK
jgi:hypothetical protein